MSQATTPTVPQLVVSLEIVARWREETEAEVHRQIKEVDEEEERVRSSIAELQRQLKAVAALREEMQERLSALDEEQVVRTRDAVLSGLESEAPLLAERADAWTEAEEARNSALGEMMADPEVAGLVEEVRQFNELEPTLDMLPAGYRKALLAHHDTVKARLKPVLAAADNALSPLPLPTMGFTLIASLDPAEGAPEALALIVPIPYDVYSRWSERGEDLHSLLAYRVVGAVAGMLSEVGASDAPLQFAPYEGKLAIQVWLGDSRVHGDIKSTLEQHVSKLRAGADELQVTRLEPYLVWLSPEAIIPEEDDDDAGADEEEV